MVLTLDLSPKIWKEINSIDIIKELMITKLKKKEWRVREVSMLPCVLSFDMVGFG